MKTIYKYEISKYGRREIRMPKGAKILSTQLQHGEPVIWALVDTSAPSVARNIDVHTTGSDVRDDDTSRFIGTLLLDDGKYVIHVLDLGEMSLGIVGVG